MGRTFCFYFDFFLPFPDKSSFSQSTCYVRLSLIDNTTTPSKIRKYFKDEFNTTPKLWINEKRLEKATLLLKTTDETISQIATSCGYSSVSWFILEFKKRYNLTPKDYRYKI